MNEIILILCKPLDLSPVLCLYEPSFQYKDNVDISTPLVQAQFASFVEGLTISSDDIDMVEKGTRGQNNNPHWFDIRASLITASNFGVVCRRRQTTEYDCLVKRLRGYELTASHVASLAYGRKHEPQASHSKMP